MKGQINNIEFDAFANLDSLRELDLSDCHIRELSMDAFIGCRRLEVLNLARNDISYLPSGIFDDALLLEEIYLENNQLRTLPTTFFLQPKLRLARLLDNPWQCSCDMSNWLPRITNQLSGQRRERCISDYQSGKKIVCHHVTTLRQDRRLAPRCQNHNGRSVFYVLHKQLQCNTAHVVHSVNAHRRVGTKPSMPHWRKVQLSPEHNSNSTYMRRMQPVENDLSYALQQHNALDEHNLQALQKQRAHMVTQDDDNKSDNDISNEI